ncbi:MAG: hypothetical protein LBM12_00985 [Candidatus Nomurabacteria bacterium]|nr:hypothetical protein [Candidatus Nomurabacteria bacterium]
MSKAAWVWLIIPAINIPLGIGIFAFAKSQMAAMAAASERRQGEILARAEQLAREEAEAESLAPGAAEDPSVSKKSSSQAKNDHENVHENTSENLSESITENDHENVHENTSLADPDVSTEPNSPAESDNDAVLPTLEGLSLSCNGLACNSLSGLTAGTPVSITVTSEEATIEVPIGWTRQSDYTISREIVCPTDGTPKPLEIEVQNPAGKLTKIVFRLDLWCESAYTNSN